MPHATAAGGAGVCCCCCCNVREEGQRVRVHHRERFVCVCRQYRDIKFQPINPNPNPSQLTADAPHLLLQLLQEHIAVGDLLPLGLRLRTRNAHSRMRLCQHAHREAACKAETRAQQVRSVNIMADMQIAVNVPHLQLALEELEHARCVLLALAGLWMLLLRCALQRVRVLSSAKVPPPHNHCQPDEQEHRCACRHRRLLQRANAAPHTSKLRS
jgi:hypothetical protein